MRGKLEPHETERAPQGARFYFLIERSSAVIPATELLATDGSCLPGPSDFAVHHCTTSMSFSARLPGERATFVSAKVAKTIRAGRNGLADIVSARLPLLLASRAPARTRTSLCSDIAPFATHPAAMLGATRRRRRSLRHHPWPVVLRMPLCACERCTNYSQDSPGVVLYPCDCSMPILCTPNQ